MTEISEKEVEAALSAWNNYSNSGPVAEDHSDAMRVALEAAACVRAEEKLPCDVQLPGVKLKRGVRLSTLLTAIRQRKDWPEEQTKLPRMAVNPAPQPSGMVKVKPLEWVASDDWEHRWIADLYAIEDQGKNWSKDRYWLYYNGQRLGKFGTLDTALFTAQADYDRRILSALTAGKPEQAVPSVAEAERERIANALEEEADTTPCSEDAVVVRDCARLVRANFSYGEAERLASTTADIAAPKAGGGEAEIGLNNLHAAWPQTERQAE